MAEEKFRVYGYRWVVMVVFMFVNLTIQILWITFGAITLPATQYYGVSDLQIGLLAMIFMIVFVPLSLPIAWVIDTFGFYKAVSLGAILMAIFGLLRGVLGSSFPAVLVCTIGLGVAQPFFLNSWTKLAARWFPIQERATAVGLATVANFIGIAIGLVVTPMLILSTSIQNVLLVYGAIAAVSSVVFILFAREAPPTPPCPPEMESRALMLVGLRSMLRSTPFWILMWIFLIGNGIFNGLSTWIESIVRPRGLNPEQAGILGGLLLLGGIVGGIALPALSDKLRKRVPFLYVGMIGSIPGLLGLTFARSYWELMVSAFAYGFFMISLAAIGYQYAAELTYPAPEGTSNALLTLAGQISVVFIFGMEALRGPDGSFTTSLLILTGCVVVAALLITRLPESTLVSNPSVQLEPAQPEEAESI